MAIAIFAVAYLFIAGARLPFFRLDRVGGALVGAVAMVALGAVPASELGAGIDVDTLLLLFGMMLISSYLTTAGFFRATAFQVMRLARTPRALLVALTAASGALSAFLVNDTVCLMLTPLVLAVVTEAKLPPLPYLLALCMGANAGSAATFTGNPQNMLIGLSSGLSYRSFSAYLALPAIVSVAVVLGVLLVLYRRELPRAPFEAVATPPPVDRPLLALCAAVLAGVVAGFFFGVSLAWCAMLGATALVALSGRSPREHLEKVDYVLLVFFASLFVLVHGVHREGWAEKMREAMLPLMEGSALRQTLGFAALTVAASNLFSNVPYVMLARHWVPAMPSPELGWHVLALASTLAGNLTLVGSVANLIVFEGARDKASLSFVGFLKVGVPVTLLGLVAGLAVLLLEHA